MMLLSDKQKTAALILGAKKSPEAEAVVEDSGEGYKIAAQEVMSALESKNVDRFASALKSFIGFCDMDSEDYGAE